MSMGLPVITTNWSGPTAFVDESVGYLLEYDLVQVRSGKWGLLAGAQLLDCWGHGES
jgi:hypothetical protein